MLAALGRAGPDLMGQRANEMTTGNRKTDQAGGCTTPPQTEAVLVAPHILIAENQPAIQNLLYWMLQLAGYHPTVCADRQTALTWADKNTTGGDVPVALLLDLSLLGANEAEDFLRHLRANWQDAVGVLPQIIVLTTNPQVHTVLGPREHALQKPFHARDLLALIRQVTPAAS